MKPKNIYILRHGESIGNLDWRHYCMMEDKDIPLSPTGNNQSATAALTLSKLIPTGNVATYSSHYHRAKETLKHINNIFGSRVTFNRTDEDMRELFWGPKTNVADAKKQNKEREAMESFYYANPGGESAKQVRDRMDGVIERLYADSSDPLYPENVIIVSHGIAIRCLLMEWLQWDDSVYPNLKNPDNCQIFNLIRTKPNGSSAYKYVLSEPYPPYPPVVTSTQ